MLLFFIKLVCNRLNELCAGGLEVVFLSVWSYFFRILDVRTHLESAEVGLEQRPVGSAEVPLHAGLGQAVCDTADKRLVSVKGLAR